MIFIKEHTHNNRKLISLCDGNLIGKEFDDGESTLKIFKDFYSGEPMFEKDIIKLIKENTLLNIVGEESIKFALNNKLIHKDGIRKIKNIPIALLL